MKFNLVMVTALLLTVCPFKLSAGGESPAVDIPEAANNSQMGWVGRINSKTWVVETIEGGAHFVVGDAFKIADINAMKRFIPFPALRGRINAPGWSKAPGEDAFIPLTMLMKELNRHGRPQERQQHFCAKIEFKNHEEIGSPLLHVMQIKVIDSRNLDIFIQEYNDENWNQCTSFPTHGGRAHATS